MSGSSVAGKLVSIALAALIIWLFGAYLLGDWPFHSHLSPQTQRAFDQLDRRSTQFQHDCEAAPRACERALH